MEVSVAEPSIKIDARQVAAFCKNRGSRRLRLFGSVLRDDFDPARSDVDILAEFHPEVLSRLGLDYFGHGEDLSQILGARVDLCSKLNRHLAQSIGKEMLPIDDEA
jgi:predicted nucleotidyltransferase